MFEGAYYWKKEVILKKGCKSVIMDNYLVLDVGGTDIKYALMNGKAEIFEKNKTPTPLANMENFLEAVGLIFDRYRDGIKGMAMSMPGRIDSDRGYAFSGGSLWFNHDTEIASLIKKRCPVPVTVENDGKCAALAEAWIGNLSDCNDGIVVVLGTGIGGGIIKDKKLHKGKHFSAGEFSHIKTGYADTKDGYLPHYWYNQCSASALCKFVAEAKGMSVEDVNGFVVFDFVDRDDEVVLKILDKYCYRIAVQLYNLQYIYDPDKIAIGGGISGEDILIEYIRKNIEKHEEELDFTMAKPEVVRCKFRNDSNLIGALYHCVTKKI